MSISNIIEFFHSCFASCVVWVKGLFNTGPVHIAIVRRYADANGNFVGELYLYDTFAGISCYNLVGCSLDSFAFGLTSLSLADEPKALDLEHDFLAPMGANTFRVGANEPEHNEKVKNRIKQIPRKNIRLDIQNRFIERVLENKAIGGKQ